ncbi:hypothetical protein C6P08_08800 [Weissella confusa]|nr:hypothetical protein C6P08_08800 [Weissella confusa]
MTTAQHLKNTGMSIADIRMYVAWIVAGEVTVPERLAFLENHRKKVLARIALEQESLAAVEVKINNYRHRIQDLEEDLHD